MCAFWVKTPKPDGSPGEGWLAEKEGSSRPWVVPLGDDWAGFKPFLFETPEEAEAWQVMRVIENAWWLEGFPCMELVTWSPPKEFPPD